MSLESPRCLRVDDGDRRRHRDVLLLVRLPRELARRRRGALTLGEARDEVPEEQARPRCEKLGTRLAVEPEEARGVARVPWEEATVDARA